MPKIILFFLIFTAYYYLNIDQKQIRAALTPLADTQQFATIWLEHYFETYGDQAPNRDETHLMIMQKTDLYNLYKHEMDTSNPPRPIVSKTRFNSLWNVLFPKCRCRPWCDIPGKCDICYEIDRLRRTEEDSIVQEKLKEAHHMHRGGMFMLERHE